MTSAGAPTRLGPYEIRSKIADGGMATVYRGVRVDGAEPAEGAPADGPGPSPSVADSEPSGGSGRGNPARRETAANVALKVIRSDFSKSPEFVDMLRDEGSIALRLRHPNIVRLYEVGVDGNQHWLAMELLEGESLWSVWEACRERGVRLRYEFVAYVGARIAEGLHHAHELRSPSGESENLVHRDVNAANVLLTWDGDVKIIDFGLAKAKNRVSRTAAGIVKGKLAYMSPEQTVGKPIDRRTDVFALGTTLWELAADRRLFKAAGDVETLKAVHAAKIPDPRAFLRDFPAPLWDVLRRALARDVADRTKDARTFAEELAALAGTTGPADVAAVVRALFGEPPSEAKRPSGDLPDSAAVLATLFLPRASVPSDAIVSIPDVPSVSDWVPKESRRERSPGARRPPAKPRGVSLRVYLSLVAALVVIAALVSRTLRGP